jgi:DNA-binding beta-propeller fold protein YncE
MLRARLILIALIATAATCALGSPANAAPPALVNTYVMAKGDPADPNPGANDVAVASDGTVYATGFAGGPFPHAAVERFTSTTTAAVLRYLLFVTPTPADTFTSVTVDAAKSVYVLHSSSSSQEVNKIVEPAGSPNTDDPAYGNGTFNGFYDIAYSPSDSRLYVSNNGNNNVVILNSSGTQIGSFNGSGTSEGNFQSPNGVALDAGGKVYVADRNTMFVKVFDHDGNFLFKFGGPPSSGGPIGRPEGVAISPDGSRAYVVDGPQANIDVFSLTSTSGTYLESFGGPGSAPGQFGSPRGIAVDSAGDIYVADGRIQCFSFNPTAPGACVPGEGTGGGGGPGGGPPLNLTGSISGRVLAERGSSQVALAGAPVEACLSDGRGCARAVSAADGTYHITSAVNGVWRVRANPPSGNNSNLPSVPRDVTVADNAASQDIVLPGVAAAPPTVSLETPFGPIKVNGVPLVRWDQPNVLHQRQCARGTLSWDFLEDGKVIRTIEFTPQLPPDKDGKTDWFAVLPPLQPHHGTIVVDVHSKCVDPGTDKPIKPFNVYLDPSGRVLTGGGAPVVGATVTLSVQDPATNVFGPVPNGSAIMSPSNRRNPDRTTADGEFAWDVLAGRYKVRAQKAGCHKVGDKKTAFAETTNLDVPPPRVGLVLRLDCGKDKKKPQISAIKAQKHLLSLRVSEPATVKALLQRCRGGRCRTAKSLTAKTKFGGTVLFVLPKAVKAGRYRVTASATDLAKNKAKPTRANVTVK